ncbi:MAG: hypothetical protein KF874_00105 [Rhizobiaceae bacterium]|nr:hypothetical protein [Rhizobiaceae bacterium]
MAHSGNDIEALVREEMWLTAEETHAEAWAECVSAGVETEIMAEAALEKALGELLRTNGESATLAMLDKMRGKVVAGEFESRTTRH